MSHTIELAITVTKDDSRPDRADRIEALVRKALVLWIDKDKLDVRPRSVDV